MNDRCIICDNPDIENYDAEFSIFVKERMFNDISVKTDVSYCPHCKIYYSSKRPNPQECDRYYKNYMELDYLAQRDKLEPGFKKWREKYMSLGGGG